MPWQTFLRDAAREAEFWSDSHQFVAMAKRKAIDDYGLHSYRKVHPAATRCQCCLLMLLSHPLALCVAAAVQLSFMVQSFLGCKTHKDRVKISEELLALYQAV
jgi:hypothetical protein